MNGLNERLDSGGEGGASGALAVETLGLSKKYGLKVALDGLEMTVPEGSFYVLVGPNGAGKTTTLSLLLDLLPSDTGTTRIFGLTPARSGAEIRSRVGYVPDVHDFGYGDLRVGQLLDYQARYFLDWDEAYAEDLERQLEIDREARYGTLSKGQARRVQLLMALAHRPDLLLLDEPTDGLDPLARDLVIGLLAEHLASSPATVLLSTHLVHEVEGLADCLGVLHRGRLVAQARRERLMARMHRIRMEVPEDWAGAPEHEPACLQRRRGGREETWTLWCEPRESRERLQASGATVRESRALNLEDGVRVLLAMATEVRP